MIGAATLAATVLLIKTTLDARLGDALLCAALAMAGILIWGISA